MKEPQRNEKGQYLPGYSGNYKGRGVGVKSFTTKIKEEMQKEAEAEGITNEAVIIRTVIKELKKGNVALLKILWEQLDGKPTQKIDNKILLISEEDEMAGEEALDNYMNTLKEQDSNRNK